MAMAIHFTARYRKNPHAVGGGPHGRTGTGVRTACNYALLPLPQPAQ
jgi:hypothetical protein